MKKHGIEISACRVESRFTVEFFITNAMGGFDFVMACRNRPIEQRESMGSAHSLAAAGRDRSLTGIWPCKPSITPPGIGVTTGLGVQFMSDAKAETCAGRRKASRKSTATHIVWKHRPDSLTNLTLMGNDRTVSLISFAGEGRFYHREMALDRYARRRATFTGQFDCNDCMEIRGCTMQLRGSFLRCATTSSIPALVRWKLGSNLSVSMQTEPWAVPIDPQGNKPQRSEAIECMKGLSVKPGFTHRTRGVMCTTLAADNSLFQSRLLAGVPRSVG